MVVTNGLVKQTVWRQAGCMLVENLKFLTCPSFCVPSPEHQVADYIVS